MQFAGMGGEKAESGKAGKRKPVFQIFIIASVDTSSARESGGEPHAVQTLRAVCWRKAVTKRLEFIEMPRKCPANLTFSDCYS